DEVAARAHAGLAGVGLRAGVAVVARAAVELGGIRARAAPPCPRAARPGRSSASRAPCRRAAPRAPRAPWGRRIPRAPGTFRTPHAANRRPPGDRKAACWRRL